MSRVEKTVRGEMHVAILAQRGTSCGREVGIEVKRLKTIGFRHERQNLVSFTARERKPMNSRRFV